MAKQIGPLTPKISNLPIGEAKSSKNRTRPVAGTFGIPYNLGGEVSGAKRTACRTSTWWIVRHGRGDLASADCEGKSGQSMNQKNGESHRGTDHANIQTSHRRRKILHELRYVLEQLSGYWGFQAVGRERNSYSKTGSLWIVWDRRWDLASADCEGNPKPSLEIVSGDVSENL